jgi:nitrogen-specific signal transduction histidine kinase
MRTESTTKDDIHLQIERLKSELGDFAHEINNPLGILRMVAYFLESTDPDAETRVRYAKMMNESLDKIEHVLQRLSALRDSSLNSPNVKEKENHVS